MRNCIFIRSCLAIWLLQVWLGMWASMGFPLSVPNGSLASVHRRDREPWEGHLPLRPSFWSTSSVHGCIECQIKSYTASELNPIAHVHEDAVESIEFLLWHHVGWIVSHRSNKISHVQTSYVTISLEENHEEPMSFRAGEAKPLVTASGLQTLCVS